MSEGLGLAAPTFTIETYQHVLPGMQADAARVFEQLIVACVLPAPKSSLEGREKRRIRAPDRVEATDNDEGPGH